jgi:glyoxylase-like metal-dependent hydrolase (beta-lactamase superfamily II)/ferredoxin
VTQRRPENVSGDFFVDSTCIDCDTCRWMAPATFAAVGDQAAVHRQPRTDAERADALRALVSCPTASIGTLAKHPMKEVLASFPIPVDGDVFHAGYHDESSFGAASYLIRRPGGNVLVDAPRFAKPLVRRLEELGGVRTMFLTHRDDVGDHAKFRAHFGCERILHAADVTGELRRIERLLEGTDPVRLDDELEVLPVPGHTRGSCVLLWKDEYLFSGDHVAWSDDLGHVYAFRSACWYDWSVQTESMARLATRTFEWILPGHGRRCHFDRDAMRAQMTHLVAWMKARA